MARSVSQNELIHATAKEIDLIFKIQAYTPKHSSLTEEVNLSDLVNFLGNRSKGKTNSCFER